MTLIFAALALLACSGSAYKILVFSPTSAKSHVLLFGKIADVLAADGHDVTLLEPHFFFDPRKLQTATIAKRRYVSTTAFNHSIVQNSITQTALQDEYLLAKLPKMMGIIDMLTTACDGLQRLDLIEDLKAQQFDAIITTHLSLCGTGLSHVLGIKAHILLSVCPLMELSSSVIGVPYPTSYVPSVLDADYPDRMGYLERAGNLFNFWFSYYVFRTAAEKMNVVFIKHYGPHFPDVDDLVKESALVLVNSDELVDFPRPTSHNVVNIGGLGLHDDRGQELKEPFKSEMAKGRRGVVFFSFGSNVRTGGLPEEVRMNLFEAFAKFSEYHFIVKVDAEDQFSKFATANYTNVMLTEWAPQQQLLAHPRMRLFITHGGYNSLLESLAHGVPMLIMSFFADQHRNARVAERNGYGVRFEKRKLLGGSNELVAVLRATLENERYRDAALRASKLMKSKPFSAEERLTSCNPKREI